MALKDLVIASEKVEIPGNDPLVVRGLGLDAVVLLVREQRDAVEQVYNKALSGELDVTSIGDVADDLADRFGPLAAKIIACGAGEPGLWQIAAALPISVQVDAIEKIGRLTFAAEGGVEKMLETVVRVMGRTAELKLPSA